ncbi:MAG: HIT domain-containing protein [Deltaproteobacteria bacterium]|nr:HIT domain-containing protein [Deltaproteobacteria bacterium]
MDHLFAPDRMKYITEKKGEQCIFCPNSGREEDLVLYDGKYCFVILNKFPYTSGHVMIVPYRHICTPEDMQLEEWLEMVRLTVRSVEVIKEVYKPGGFNIGMNVGKAAGAGIDCHLHMHIVPRWPGDTNFSTVIGGVRIIPQGLDEAQKRMRPHFEKMEV